MAKILITTSSFELAGNPALEALRAAGHNLVTNPHARRLDEDEIAALMDADTIGIIAGLEPLTAAVMARAPALEVISRCGVGVDNVDLDAARERGIAVVNTPDAPVASVAELTLALMLACLRRLTEGDRRMRAGEWPRLSGALLGARTVGLLGCGRIGARVATLCQAFGAEVAACDPGVHELPSGVQRLDFEALLARSEVLSLHAPALAGAAPLLDAATLARLPRGAIVINTARGGLIDDVALKQALESGQIAAAGIDVFEPEPYHGVLIDCAEVVLSPHLGSGARETRQRMEHEAASNLLAALTRV